MALKKTKSGIIAPEHTIPENLKKTKTNKPTRKDAMAAIKQAAKDAGVTDTEKPRGPEELKGKVSEFIIGNVVYKVDAYIFFLVQEFVMRSVLGLVTMQQESFDNFFMGLLNGDDDQEKKDELTKGKEVVDLTNLDLADDKTEK